MAWFKVDDHLYSHPKWLALPKSSRALWITAGSWSAGQLYDGFIPRKALAMLEGTKREADTLVEAGLWSEVDGGWLFHDWAEYQPTRSAVMEKRKRDAERLRRWREKRDEERE